MFVLSFFINFFPEHRNLFQRLLSRVGVFFGCFVGGELSRLQLRAVERGGRARATAGWAASVGRSQGCPSCAAAQTKVPFFPSLVGSPSMRGPCPTNRNQTSVIVVSLIKHDSFTALYKHFDLLSWCNRLRRFFGSSSFMVLMEILQTCLFGEYF